MEQPEILNCPFCGGNSYYTRSVNGTEMHYVGCSACGVYFKASEIHYPNPLDDRLTKDIVAAWNTRAVRADAHDLTVEEVAEQLKEKFPGTYFTIEQHERSAVMQTTGLVYINESVARISDLNGERGSGKTLSEALAKALKGDS